MRQPSGPVRALLLGAVASAASIAAARGGDSNEFIYIQRLTHESVVVAWGGPGRGGANTIGESSLPFGPAELEIFYRPNGRPVPGSPFRTKERNWIEATLPEPSREYGYELRVNGRPWGDPVYREEGLLYFRSSPRPTDASGRLSFLVLGDFGTGSKKQHRLAESIGRLVEEQELAGSPIRFVLTTGDNFYDFFLFVATGSDDKEFYKKLFIPYQRLLSRIVFFPTLGNHDGSESESTRDLAHYRDNFFLPPAILGDGRPSQFEDRFYAVSYGRDIRLLCLDTTRNRETRAGITWQPIYDDGGVSEQRRWLEAELERTKGVLWKIAWFHHPPFNAGRGHYGPRSKDPILVEVERALVPLLAEGAVRVVFSGHVHNFQITREESEGHLKQTRYLVTGAGGKSERGRRGSSGLHILRRERMEATNADDEPHFLLVSIDGDRMEVMPLTYGSSGDRPVPLAVRTYENKIYGNDEPRSPYHPIVIEARPR